MVAGIIDALPIMFVVWALQAQTTGEFDPAIYLMVGLSLPTVLLFILLFALAIASFFLWMSESAALGVFGTVAGIGLFFLVVFLMGIM